MNGIAMTTERGNANSAVFKFFQPGFRFSAVIAKVVERTMVVVWVASRADLHGFQAQGSDFVQHGVKRKMFVNRIEHANWNLAQVTRRLGRLLHARALHSGEPQLRAGRSWRQETLSVPQRSS